MGSTRIEQGWNGDPEQLFDCIVIGGWTGRLDCRALSRAVLATVPGH